MSSEAGFVLKLKERRKLPGRCSRPAVPLAAALFTWLKLPLRWRPLPRRLGACGAEDSEVGAVRL